MVTREYIYDILYSAKEVHMNMLRVWGGNIKGVTLPMPLSFAYINQYFLKDKLFKNICHRR